MSYQDTEGTVLVFEAMNEVKKQETKFLLSLKKFPFQILSLKPSKRTRSKCYQGMESCRFGL